MLTFALRPAIKVGTVAYYQLNLDTIVENYCVNKKRPSLQCNGKCYLSKQLNLNTSTTDSTPITTAIAEAFFPLFFKAYTDQIQTPIRILDHKTVIWFIQDIAVLHVLDSIDYPPERNSA